MFSGVNRHNKDNDLNKVKRDRDRDGKEDTYISSDVYVVVWCI